MKSVLSMALVGFHLKVRPWCDRITWPKDLCAWHFDHILFLNSSFSLVLRFFFNIRHKNTVSQTPSGLSIKKQENMHFSFLSVSLRGHKKGDDLFFKDEKLPPHTFCPQIIIHRSSSSPTSPPFTENKAPLTSLSQTRVIKADCNEASKDNVYRFALRFQFHVLISAAATNEVPRRMRSPVVPAGTRQHNAPFVLLREWE